MSRRISKEVHISKAMLEPIVVAAMLYAVRLDVMAKYGRSIGEVEKADAMQADAEKLLLQVTIVADALGLDVQPDTDPT